jgi:hypothetical protein
MLRDCEVTRAELGLAEFPLLVFLPFDTARKRPDQYTWENRADRDS